MGDYGKNKQYQKKGTALFNRPFSAGVVAVGADFQITTQTLFNDSTSIIATSETQITLKAGKKYRINVECFIEQTTAVSFTNIRLYNQSTSAYVGPIGIATSVTRDVPQVGVINAKHIIVTTVDTIISLRYLNGTTASNYYATSVVVEEVEALLSETLGQTTFQDAVFNGYSQFGESAPKIKMKKLTGTTASTEGGTVGVAHGLSLSKIISFTGVIHIDSTTAIPLGYKPETSGNQVFEVYCYVSGGGFNIINHATNSENILSKPFTITVWYEE